MRSWMMMWSHLAWHRLLLLIVTGTVVMFGLLSMGLHQFEPVLYAKKERLQKQYLVNTPECKIPNFDPFDNTIKNLILKGESISCNATAPALTYTDDLFLRINRTALELFYKNDLENCMYQSIYRPVENSDNLHKYDSKSVWFKEDISVISEYIRVACYSKQTDLIYTNFHTFVPEKPQVESRCEKQHQIYLETHHPKEKLNLLILGIDSVSRLNFIRQMPKTKRFLLNKLSAIELKGYNKVADNTFVNLVPLFAGKFVEELPWQENIRKPFDDYNFVWKNFSNQGYRTLFAEDAPRISIFNYLREGFYQPPADYYLRPFSLALEDHGAIWKNNHHCVGPKLETEVVLDYVHDFMRKFKHKPFYAFAFLTRLTHENMNQVGAADEPYFQLLNKLHDEGFFENTVLVFFSDHGMRFGAIRQFVIGKLEERLPLMYLAFPKWFNEKYPHIEKNLRINENRLTTPFDIYETLVDLLEFDGKSKEASISQRGISLFSAIPQERTCDSAAILPHWCTCHQETPVRRDSAMVLQACHYVIQTINQELASYKGLCSHLHLAKITEALKVEADDKVLRFDRSVNDVINRTVFYGKRSQAPLDYGLTFTTKPGGALFEATVRYYSSGNKFQIVGDISRINAYGEQSHCINQHKHKKFCYCQDKK